METLIQKRNNDPCSKRKTKQQLFLNQDGLCNICNNKFDFLVLDHIIPLGMGGEDNFNNLQLICIDCNIKKNSKDLRDIWNNRKRQKHELPKSKDMIKDIKKEVSK